MGCFSFLCKESGKPALSTSFDGTPCHLFLLKDGQVIEHMFGNYDSYGRAFKKGKVDSFKWSTDWSRVCDLMFMEDESNGIALILKEHYSGTPPTTRSEDDPNQGWGGEDEGEGCYFASTDSNVFEEVFNPYHNVYGVYTEDEEIDIKIEED